MSPLQFAASTSSCLGSGTLCQPSRNRVPHSPADPFVSPFGVDPRYNQPFRDLRCGPPDLPASLLGRPAQVTRRSHDATPFKVTFGSVADLVVPHAKFWLKQEARADYLFKHGSTITFCPLV